MLDSSVRCPQLRIIPGDELLMLSIQYVYRYYKILQHVPIEAEATFVTGPARVFFIIDTRPASLLVDRNVFEISKCLYLNGSLKQCA
jgi:hypothetical protein